MSVVRNPIDRAISDYKTFGALYGAGVEYAENFGLVMDQSWQLKNHYILYFEDLLATPLAEVVELYHFLGRSDLEINLENLVQQSGKPYRVETSDLSDVGKRHTEGLPHTGFDLTRVGKDVSGLPIEIVDEFRRVINTYAIYDRYRD